MYNVSNGTLKVGQAEQYKASALSLKTAEIFRIWGGGGGSRQVIFIFAAISRSTDILFFNVFTSLDLSFH